MSRTILRIVSVAAAVICSGLTNWSQASAKPFTKLAVTPATIVAASPAFDDSYAAQNLVSPPPTVGPRPEYASRGQGTQTYLDFDFGAARPIAAFRHVQRQTPDTVSQSQLIFSDSPDFRQPSATVAIKHVDEPGAASFLSFPQVTARYVRWQVTAIRPGGLMNVGARSVEFFASSPEESRPNAIQIVVHAVPITVQKGTKLLQPLKVTFHYPYAESTTALVSVDGQTPQPVELSFGEQTMEFTCQAADTEHSIPIELSIEGAVVATNATSVAAVRPLTVYILPHSHTDIGYTALQTDIEEKQMNNLLLGIAAARRTANYPPGARFIWNVEVSWAADLVLQRLSETQRTDFIEAVKNGQVALNGMYLNELTGLCRPEELVRLFRFAAELGDITGVPVDSAMISDVPGYTWGTVTAMNQAGIRYFSVAPNYFDRIGDIMVQWENRPFWWVGPDGQSKVLVWIPFWGYAMSHRYGQMSAQLVEDFVEGLESRNYPYDIAYVRWSGRGDNALPDPSICDFVKDWNAAHVSPRFVISSTGEAFSAFEQRYGKDLPEARGDWSPYWEDGAGSSAAETAMNRASSERLAQAETLWAMLNPQHYPAAKLAEAWNQVLLYSEHTWGAHCSISQPAIPFTTDQWTIKQSYATAANLLSRQRLADAVQRSSSDSAASANEPAAPLVWQVDVYNTSSWPRSELVVLPQEISGLGDQVVDDHGQAVPAQRLSTQELAIFVSDLPPLAGRRYSISPRSGGSSAVSSMERLGGPVQCNGATLANNRVRVVLDEATGGIVELRLSGVDENFVDRADGQALNEYLYLIGDNLRDLQKNGPVQISTREAGPLVASLLVESSAPGCHRLTREIRMTAGTDYVEMINTVDKKRLESDNYYAPQGKESVNFGFPFRVPQGTWKLDLPLAVIQPEADQLPSACKNWLTVGRWADVSNGDLGVTWITLDAPLLQVGGLTARMLNSQTNPAVWRKSIEPTQKIYSWVMNNHWGTNYRAYQEGPTVFRFVVRPHQATTIAEASRLATNFSQPLVAASSHGTPPSSTPRLQVDCADVLVSGMKPSDDGKAVILRLFGASDHEQSVNLSWADPQPVRLCLSDTREQSGQPITGAVHVPARGLVTLRAELPPQ